MYRAAAGNIRLNQRDLEIFVALYRFGGLTLQAINDVHFGGAPYGLHRLALLKRARYLGRRLYYEKEQGQKRALRQAAVYYLESKGLQVLQKNLRFPRIEPIEPQDGNLDVQVLLSRLYTRYPEELLSGREAKQEYRLPDSVPIAALLSNPPTGIILLSPRTRPREQEAVARFLETAAVAEEPIRYVIVARWFPRVLEGAAAHFVFWHHVDRVIPELYRHPSCFTERFVFAFRERYPDVPVFREKAGETEFYVAGMPSGPLYLAELASGSLQLARALRRPERPFCLYVLDRSQLDLIRLEKGSLAVYSAADRTFYLVQAQNGRPRIRQLSPEELRDLPKGGL